MDALDLETVRRYVLARLADELPGELTYHSLAHTRDDVAPAALRLARQSGVSAEDQRLVEVAALFHDLGYVEQGPGHEGVSARIARQALPALGCGPEEIEKIAGMILATKLPQSPHNLLEEILADADLDGLGREDFFDRNQALRDELLSSGTEVTDREWYRQQLEFLEGHRYHTKTASALREEGKRKNVSEVKRRLRDLERRGF